MYVTDIYVSYVSVIVWAVAQRGYITILTFYVESYLTHIRLQKFTGINKNTYFIIVCI